MTSSLRRVRHSGHRRIVVLLSAAVAAVGVAAGLAVWSPGRAAAATIRPGAKVVTVTPLFGRDPNVSRHHLDHAFTITDPAKVNEIVKIINGLAPFPRGELACARDNGAAMRLTFRTSLKGAVVSTLLATYTGCSGISTPQAPALPFLVGTTHSGKRVQQLVLSIAGVRWPYTPNVLPSF